MLFGFGFETPVKVALQGRFAGRRYGVSVPRNCGNCRRVRIRPMELAIGIRDALEGISSAKSIRTSSSQLDEPVDNHDETVSVSLLRHRGRASVRAWLSTRRSGRSKNWKKRPTTWSGRARIASPSVAAAAGDQPARRVDHDVVDHHRPSRPQGHGGVGRNARRNTSASKFIRSRWPSSPAL